MVKFVVEFSRKRHGEYDSDSTFFSSLTKIGIRIHVNQIE